MMKDRMIIYYLCVDEVLYLFRHSFEISLLKSMLSIFGFLRDGTVDIKVHRRKMWDLVESRIWGVNFRFYIYT